MAQMPGSSVPRAELSAWEGRGQQHATIVRPVLERSRHPERVWLALWVTSCSPVVPRALVAQALECVLESGSTIVPRRKSARRSGFFLQCPRDAAVACQAAREVPLSFNERFHCLLELAVGRVSGPSVLRCRGGMGGAPGNNDQPKASPSHVSRQNASVLEFDAWRVIMCCQQADLSSQSACCVRPSSGVLFLTHSLFELDGKSEAQACDSV